MPSKKENRSRLAVSDERETFLATEKPPSERRIAVELCRDGQ